jgi:hypothetical protein
MRALFASGVGMSDKIPQIYRGQSRLACTVHRCYRTAIYLCHYPLENMLRLELYECYKPAWAFEKGQSNVSVPKEQRVVLIDRLKNEGSHILDLKPQ